MIVYVLRCKDVSVHESYIGYTRDLSHCIDSHHDNSLMRNTKLYRCIRVHGGMLNWEFIVLHSCSTVEEALAHKQRSWSLLHCSLNQYIPGVLEHVIDYSCTSIYKIYCLDPCIVSQYIGHTTNYESRYESHMLSSSYSNMKLYEYIRVHGGWSNWCMVPIKVYHCLHKGEAHRLEWYWWNKVGGVLNSCIPGNDYVSLDKIQIENFSEYYDAFEVDASTPDRHVFFSEHNTTIDL